MREVTPFHGPLNTALKRIVDRNMEAILMPMFSAGPWRFQARSRPHNPILISGHIQTH